MTDWVKCSDRLPKPDSLVLAFEASNTYGDYPHVVVVWDGHRWVSASWAYERHDITHWLPIPPKPKNNPESN